MNLAGIGGVHLKAVTGDFNGDGKKDIATTLEKSSTEQVVFRSR